MLISASGTEPLLRVMVEARDAAQAQVRVRAERMADAVGVKTPTEDPRQTSQKSRAGDHRARLFLPAAQLATHSRRKKLLLVKFFQSNLSSFVSLTIWDK